MHVHPSISRDESSDRSTSETFSQASTRHPNFRRRVNWKGRLSTKTPNGLSALARIGDPVDEKSSGSFLLYDYVPAVSGLRTQTSFTSPTIKMLPCKLKIGTEEHCFGFYELQIRTASMYSTQRGPGKKKPLNIQPDDCHVSA